MPSRPDHEAASFARLGANLPEIAINKSIQRYCDAPQRLQTIGTLLKLIISSAR